MAKKLEDKLRDFKSVVLREANQKAQIAIDEIEKTVDAEAEENENKFLSEAYEDIQREIREVRHANNSRLLHVDIESKRELLKAREEIVEKVFSAVKDKLSEYVKSDEYVDWVIGKISGVNEMLGDGEYRVLVSNADEKTMSALKDKFSDIAFEIDTDANSIGGVKIFNDKKRTAVDYRFSTLIEAEHSEFLKNGELSIGD